MKRGLERNFDRASERLTLQRAEALARSAYLPYSPLLTAAAGYQQYQPVVGAPGYEHHFAYSLGGSWRTLVGTTVAVDASVDQGLPGSTNPLHGASVGLSVSQALLKDGWRAASLPVREAGLASRIQHELYRSAENRLLLDLDVAYWNLALAESDVAIKARSRDRAHGQFNDTAENIRRGILAEGEIHLVAENAVIFDQELVRAEQALRLAQRQLAELLALDPSTSPSAQDKLEFPAMTLPDAASSEALALREHPVLSEQRLRIELAGTRVRYYENQTLPRLDLKGAAALRGWDPRYGDAWKQVVSRPERDIRTEISLAVPLDRSAVSSALDAAVFDERRERNELKRLEASVRFEVADALTNLAGALNLVALAKKQVEFAELKLQTQDDKYKSGLSTLADVVRFQRDVDNALIAYRRVIWSVHVGRARFLAAQGTLVSEIKS